MWSVIWFLLLGFNGAWRLIKGGLWGVLLFVVVIQSRRVRRWSDLFFILMQQRTGVSFQILHVSALITHQGVILSALLSTQSWQERTDVLCDRRLFLCFHTEVSFHSIPLTCLQAENSLKSLTFIAFPPAFSVELICCADGEFVFGVGKDQLKHVNCLLRRYLLFFGINYSCV